MRGRTSVISAPFLTELDSRAEVRGSVDPLGAMAIWTRLGRRVVGNLSTVTSSVRDFKTLVLGFGLLRELRRAAGPDAETDDLAAFLRWEQLAAYYPRCVAGEGRCPPEDCGGVHGYAEFLQIIADADHEEHESTLRWAGGQFDPEAFDPAAVKFDNPKKRWKKAFGHRR